MFSENESLSLPDYNDFAEAIAFLNLPVSVSFLHGMMCGYLSTGADKQGETYLRALLGNKKEEQARRALLAMFDLFFISQLQINNFDFNFHMLLPEEDESLSVRTRAFSEWCEGFSEAISLAGISMDSFQDEETQDAVHHLREFAALDYESVEAKEDDEQALMEISEYARMAVIRIYNDVKRDERQQDDSGVTH